MLRLARAIPWLLLLGAFVWLGVLSLPHGPTLLIDVMPAWLLVIAIERAFIRPLSRAPRIVADLGLGLICLFLLELDGLWVLPSVIAFALVDLISAPLSAQAAVGSRERTVVILGAGTALAALATLGFLLTAPLYSTAETSISSTGAVIETQGTASLADVGFPLALGLFLLALAGAVVWGAILDAAGTPGGRTLIGFVAAALAVLAIAGGFSIGLFLVPTAILATLTWVAASGGKPRPG